MFETDFDERRRLSRPLGVVVEDVLALLEATGRVAVEAPQQGVEQRGLADAVFRVDQCDVLGSARRIRITFSPWKQRKSFNRISSRTMVRPFRASCGARSLPDPSLPLRLGMALFEEHSAFDADDLADDAVKVAFRFVVVEQARQRIWCDRVFGAGVSSPSAPTIGSLFVPLSLMAAPSGERHRNSANRTGRKSYPYALSRAPSKSRGFDETNNVRNIIASWKWNRVKPRERGSHCPLKLIDARKRRAVTVKNASVGKRVGRALYVHRSAVPAQPEKSSRRSPTPRRPRAISIGTSFGSPTATSRSCSINPSRRRPFRPCSNP